MWHPLVWLTQRLCPHFDRFVVNEPDRKYTRCQACGYESPGWTLTPARPALPVEVKHSKRRAPKPRVVALKARPEAKRA